jgi:hypothetical protein
VGFFGTFLEKTAMAAVKELLIECVETYIETALWATTDDNGDPLDRHYSPTDVAYNEFCKLQDLVSQFLSHDQVSPLAQQWDREDYWQAMHDFFLTRNGHGAGFWDGGWPEADEKILTAVAKSFGESQPYVGDDESIYFS